MLMNSVAISLLVQSDLGISTLSSLPWVLHAIFPGISFGWMNFFVQAFLLLMVMLITRQPKPTYPFSFLVAFVFGLLVDVCRAGMIDWSDALPWRVLFFLIGWAMISCGAALFVLSSMPLMPFDLVVRDLSDFSGKSVQRIKTMSDLCFVGSGMVLSASLLGRVVGVGVGTVLMMFWNGFWIQRFMHIWTRHFDFRSQTHAGQFLERIGKIRKAED